MNSQPDFREIIKESSERLRLCQNDEYSLTSIYIEGENNASLVIEEQEIQNSNGTKNKFLIIYKSGGDKPLYKIPKSSFKSIIISNTINSRVFIMCKLLKILFENCDNVQISIRQPVVGMVEFLRCKNSNIHIRIPSEEDGNDPKIPLVRIEECDSIKIFQSNPEIFYVLRLSYNIQGVIVDYHTKERLKNFSLGKLFWGNGEQRFVSLSTERGFEYSDNPYHLNDITHMIFTDRHKIEDNVNDIFGTTPPSRNFFR